MKEAKEADVWQGAKTLSEAIYSLVESQQTKSPEFESILKYYGREKIKELYLLEKEKQKRGSIC